MSILGDYEAVAFTQFGPWHAVRRDIDRTFCGLNPHKAPRMYNLWSEHQDRCRNCVRAIKS